MRIKKGLIAAKRRRNVLSLAKGYRFGRSKKEKEAKQAITRAGVMARRDRRAKKADFRGMWQVKIGAAVRPLGLSYSRFAGALKKANISLDRKSLADLAENEAKTFEKVVAQVK